MSGNATPSLPEPTIEQIVSCAVRLNREIKEKTTDLDKLKAVIVAKGAGKHSGMDGETVTVVAESPKKEGVVTYDAPLITPSQIEKARELAGEEFPKLFTRFVMYVPCKSFADVLPKLITAAKKVAELLKLCGTMGKPYDGKKAYVKFD
jgi:hypothetical protein